MEGEENNILLTELYRHYFVMKTYHFQTNLAFRHTKTDEYLTKYLGNMDKIMEVLQGIESTVTLKKIRINEATVDDNTVFNEIAWMITELEKQRGRYASVDAVLDQMQSDLQQLNYLFHFA